MLSNSVVPVPAVPETPARDRFGLKHPKTWKEIEARAHALREYKLKQQNAAVR